MTLNPLNRNCNAYTNVQWQSTPKQTFYITIVGPKSGFLLWDSNNLPVTEWYFLALLGRKEWKSTRKGKLRIFLQEIWTKDNPNHKIFCFSLEFFLNGLMWGLNDGVVSRGTEWVEANGRSERSPEAHNPIMKTPHHSMKEKFWAET